jgi:hypothetical protein
MGHEGCTQKGKKLFMPPKKNDTPNAGNQQNGNPPRQRLPPSDAPKEGEPEKCTNDKGEEEKYCARCKKWNKTHTTLEHIAKKNRKAAGLARTSPAILSNRPSVASTIEEHPSNASGRQSLLPRVTTEVKEVCDQPVSSLTFSPGLMYCNTGPTMIEGLSSYDKDELVFYDASAIPDDSIYESMNVNIKVNNNTDVFYDALEFIPLTNALFFH